MTVLRGAAWACALVAGGLVIGGCTPVEPEPRPTTPVETSTSAPETSEPTVAAPEMPNEAAEASAAGAEAWVRHWIDLLNYAYDTGDTEPLAALSPSVCKVCSGTISDINEIYGAGGRLEGAEMVPSRVLSPPPDARNLVAVGVTFTEAASIRVNADGSRTEEPATAETEVGFVLVHENGAWQLRGIGTQ